MSERTEDLILPTAMDSWRWHNWQQRLQASTYLQRLHQRDHMRFSRLWQQPWQEMIAECVASPQLIDSDLPEQWGTCLRQQKRVLMMVLAGLDYGHLAGESFGQLYTKKANQNTFALPQQEDIIGALSDFAAMSIEIGLRICLQQHGYDDTSGIAILAMGKLGGRELNYSSDIDVIVLYDREQLSTSLPLSRRDASIMRITKQWVQFMQQNTSEGYLFRTDLRLRPDPLSTPPAVEVNAAIHYYESAGLGWERAAMIKARPVAGDINLATVFLQNIKGFLWRRHLDYASVADIRDIRRRAIRAMQSNDASGVNVKLVEGGIRDIELHVQSFQLIWGGKNPLLRVKPTLAALEALVSAGLVSATAARDLRAAYRYYRRLEHAVQLLDDQQRHDLPNCDEEWRCLSILMQQSEAEIKIAFLDHRQKVQAVCRPVSMESQQESVILEQVAPNRKESHLVDQSGSQDSPSHWTDAQWQENTQKLGFYDTIAVQRTVAVWLSGRYRTTATPRARRLLEQLLHGLLLTLGQTCAPDDALMRMDRFFEALPAGVQLFSLWAASPRLLQHCADIMGNAPRLAEWLSRKPSLFEHLLQPFDYGISALQNWDVDGEAVPLERALDDCRSLAHENEFRASVGFMSGKVDLTGLQTAMTHSAEEIILHTLQHIRQAHNILPQQGLAILALGKLGQRRLIPASDLDLIIVYDDESPHEARRFVKLVQRLISGLSVATAEGTLYDIDMRLRPHGNAGSVVSALSMMQHYYEHEAWMWEHFALSQARVLYADPDLQPDITGWLSRQQQRRHCTQRMIAAIIDMRRRLQQAFPTKDIWNLKHHVGGLMDAEFCRQFLQLCLVGKNADFVPEDLPHLLDNAQQYGLITSAQAVAFIEDHGVMDMLQTALRITISPTAAASGRMSQKADAAQSMFRLDQAPPGQVSLLCRVALLSKGIATSNKPAVQVLEDRLRQAYVRTQALCDKLFITG